MIGLKPGPVKSPCGAANLLAAIFGKPANEVKAHLGLPLSPSHSCKGCGKPLIRKLSFKGFCQQCRYVSLSCSCGCGEFFLRRQWLVLQRARKGYQHFFKDRHHLGRWAGKYHGFIAHPENIRKEKHATS